MKVGPLRHRTRVVRVRVVTLSWFTMQEAARELGVADSTVRDRHQEGRFKMTRTTARPRGGRPLVLIADHCVRAEAEARLCECRDGGAA